MSLQSLPKRKACDELSAEMLCKNASKVHDTYCIDEIDESALNRKMTKVIEHLEKLNTDCNMTAGLKAKFSLAIGARVTLRHNIDTKARLVSGTIGQRHRPRCRVSGHLVTTDGW